MTLQNTLNNMKENLYTDDEYSIFEKQLESLIENNSCIINAVHNEYSHTIAINAPWGGVKHFSSIILWENIEIKKIYILPIMLGRMIVT